VQTGVKSAGWNREAWHGTRARRRHPGLRQPTPLSLRAVHVPGKRGFNPAGISKSEVTFSFACGLVLGLSGSLWSRLCVLNNPPVAGPL
jgi:hypothetical protein